MRNLLEEIKKTTIAGDREKLSSLVKKALEEGIEIKKIINDGFTEAMGIVGKEFGAGRIYIPEMIIAARAMKSGLEIIKPFIVQKDINITAKIVIGTVQGDLHDIGKNLVVMMLEGSGFEVIDLGIDVPPDKFVEAIRELKPKFLGMSALLTTAIPSIKKTIEAIEGARLRNKIKILVGGAFLTQELAWQVGADAYGKDASDAVELVKKLYS